MTLTPEQQRIADTRGLVAVNACPGAGKTKLVATRMATLVQDVATAPFQGIAAISFTHTAVREIKKEFRRLTGAPANDPHFIGTIDSFLTRYIFLPFGNTILGKSKNKPIILEPDSPWVNIKYTSGKYKNLHGFPLSKYRYSKDGSIVPQGKNCTLIRDMKADMRAHNLATIPDAAYWSLELLKKYPRITRLITTRFPFIMVDEAQDASDVQMAIIDLLQSSGHSEIMLLGDPYQAIYEFRDAEPKLLVEKVVNPAWAHENLDTTHRCCSVISATLNRCHSADLSREIIPIGLPPGHVLFIDGDNATTIVGQYFKSISDYGIQPSKDTMAILYGAHNSSISRRRVTDNDISSYFQSDYRERHSAFLLAIRDIELGDNEKALHRMMRLSFVLKHKRNARTIEEIEHDEIGTIRVRSQLWIFLKSLTDTSVSLQDWVNGLNVSLSGLAKQLGFTVVLTVGLNRNKRAEYSKPLCKILHPEGVCNQAQSMTITNIHQVKGRTFEAVMVYLENGNNKMFAEGRLIKLLKGGRAFDKINEWDRCLYVAMSRAKQILCFAGSTKLLKEFWAETSEGEKGEDDRLLFKR